MSAGRIRPQRRFPSGGSLQIADDDRGYPCYVCGELKQVRFLQFNSPTRGDRVFLRLCRSCLEELAREELSMQTEEDQ